jgi:hypothetical protein
LRKCVTSIIATASHEACVSGQSSYIPFFTLCRETPPHRLTLHMVVPKLAPAAAFSGASQAVSVCVCFPESGEKGGGRKPPHLQAQPVTRHEMINASFADWLDDLPPPHGSSDISSKYRKFSKNRLPIADALVVASPSDHNPGSLSQIHRAEPPTEKP